MKSVQSGKRIKLVFAGIKKKKKLHKLGATARQPQKLKIHIKSWTLQAVLCLSQSNIHIFKNLLTGFDKEKKEGDPSKEQKRSRLAGEGVYTLWEVPDWSQSFFVTQKDFSFSFFFFLLHPQVKVYPLSQWEHRADDVLVMGTDGLWDVLSNQEVSEAVTSFLANCDEDDQHRQVRFTMSHSWTSVLIIIRILFFKNSPKMWCFSC